MMDILIKECIIKVYDDQLNDLTPNILVKPAAQDQNSSPTIYTSRQSRSNDNVQCNNQNKQINIKTYKYSENQGNSGDSVQSQTQRDQTFKNLTDLIKQYLNDSNLSQQLIVAKEYDYRTGQKIKYKLIISQNIHNYIIVAFIKLDEVYLAKQQNRLVEFKQQLAQIFTHKLKTPLNATLGYLNSALNDACVCDRSKNIYLKPALLNSKLQLYQVQDLLDYLNQDVTQMNLSIQKVNLTKLLSSINDSLEQQCRLKEIALNFYINGVDWKFQQQQSQSTYIHTDQQKLERVLLNLLNNSYRYSPPNSNVTVDIIIDEPEQKAFFHVSDDGEGFTDEQMKFINNQALIQNKVQLVHHQDKYLHFKKNVKFGLSLQITNKLIYALSDQHSSLQLCTSSMGANFEFFISTRKVDGFPSSQKVITAQAKFHRQYQQSFEQDNGSIYSNNCSSMIIEPSPQKPLTHCLVEQRSHRNPKRYPSIQASQRSGGGMHNFTMKRQQLCESIDLDVEQKILIVDDEPFNHDILSLMLQKLGFTKFIKAFNGQECIDKITNKSQNIKFIFMDLDMPVLGGIEVSEIQYSQTTQILVDMMGKNKVECIPIIGCTAHDDYDTYLNCIEAGMTHVIGKPVFLKDIHDLFLKLRDEQKLKIPFISQSLEKHNYY